MQTVLSRIWTQLANSISHDDNFYAKHSSKSNGSVTFTPGVHIANWDINIGNWKEFVCLSSIKRQNIELWILECIVNRKSLTFLFLMVNGGCYWEESLTIKNNPQEAMLLQDVSNQRELKFLSFKRKKIV